MSDLLLSNYDYHLPPDLIASYPASPRESARLLVFDRKDGSITHSSFENFYDFVPKDTLIVLNDTKVIKARMYGAKLDSGAKVEVFYHKFLGDDEFLVQIKGRVSKNTFITLSNNFSMVVLELLDGGFRKVRFFIDSTLASVDEVLAHIELVGHIPLPPYIKRGDEDSDKEQYQSVFAKNIGAVASPTASLHFSDIEYLKNNFDHCFVTLHVGAGTFVGVESENILDHKIHTEDFSISQECIKKINSDKKILCIGTTSARVVEFAYRNGFDSEVSGKCDIFLHPLNKPKRVDYLLTNFHLPKSTLIMLVSSMVGREKCMEIYKEAIDKKYRFYSYGDGMLIL